MLLKGFEFIAALLIALSIFAWSPSSAWAKTQPLPFAPGENLKFKIKWENLTAGEIKLQVQPIKSIHGKDAFHFVMITKSKGLAEVFFKIRERIDAYADIQMDYSVFYTKRQTEGEHKRDEKIEFDWTKGQVQYSNFNKKRKPIEVLPGSFDPLSAFYFMRIAIDHENSQMKRPVTDGKKNFMGRAEVVKRETITLSNGKSFDTYCLVPDMGLFGGVFKESKEPSLHVWVTADSKRIPVRIKSKVVVGYFVCELISATGI